jgi:UDP-3-O-[3-hydroxymyristoyl] glucosamine N-acyltransferase
LRGIPEQPDGTYRVIAPTIVKIGNSTIILSSAATEPGTKIGLSSSVIAPGTKIGNAEVYEALDSRCGRTHG